MTGLVDAHAHLTMDFAGTGLRGAALVERNLAAMGAAGVIAARDVGRAPGAPDPGVPAAPSFLAPAGLYHAHLHEPVAAEDVVAVATAQARAGAPWIKVIADFPGADGNWFAPRVSYPFELLEELVRAVHAEGARVAAHVSGPFVASVVRAGIDTVEHGPLVDAPLLEEMAERGTIWVPTVATIIAHVGPLPQWRAALPVAASLGVPVLAGSDELGSERLPEELATLIAMGLPQDVAEHGATTLALEVLGLAAPVRT